MKIYSRARYLKYKAQICKTDNKIRSRTKKGQKSKSIKSDLELGYVFLPKSVIPIGYIRKRCPDCDRQMFANPDFETAICQKCGHTLRIVKRLKAFYLRDSNSFYLESLMPTEEMQGETA